MSKQVVKLRSFLFLELNLAFFFAANFPVASAKNVNISQPRFQDYRACTLCRSSRDWH